MEIIHSTHAAQAFDQTAGVIPVVSVCLVTYNHEHFIGKAIEGVLAQKTTFPIEILVADDCSTDSAPQIAREFARRNPQRSRILDRPRNLGANRNFRAALGECRGKYIAILDGDDYWTSPMKLQRQFEFLETRPGCVACFHPVTIIHDGTEEPPSTYRPQTIRETYELSDLLRQNEFATCSAMIRRDRLPQIPEWYCDLLVGDWPLYAMLAEHGSLGFIDKVMAVYRIHAGGAWSRQDKVGRLRERLATYSAMSGYFQGRQDSIIRPILARTCVELAQEFEIQGNFAKAKSYANEAIKCGALKSPVFRKRLSRMLVRFHLPPVYRVGRRIHRLLRGGSDQAGNS